MTAKPSMLTIALTVAVSALLVDRMIEPAQAQDCASRWEVKALEATIDSMATDVQINQMKLESAQGQLDTLSMQLDTIYTQLDLIQTLVE